jgi:hypothetical protein
MTTKPPIDCTAGLLPAVEEHARPCTTEEACRGGFYDNPSIDD